MIWECVADISTIAIRWKTTLRLDSMIKRLIYTLLVLAGIVIASYLLQPIKKVEGADKAVRYELEKNWLRLPGTAKSGNPTGIAIDQNQNLVVFHRAGREWSLLGSMPDEPIRSKTILVIDKNRGKLIHDWGADLFVMPHGLAVDEAGNTWVTDVGLHQVFKFNRGGKLLLKIGEANVSGNDSLHFNKPTDIAVAQDGSFYVADGYGNSRVVKFSATGTYLFEWGTKGNKQSEFNIPHGICLDGEANVYVADRENNRIQKFDSSGKFLQQWADDSFGAVCAVAVGKENQRWLPLTISAFYG